jgi:hypothetical protein
MGRFTIATVEVTAPDGTKTLWVAGLPHSEAVAAVKKKSHSSHSRGRTFFREFEPQPFGGGPHSWRNPSPALTSQQPQTERRQLACLTC